MFECPGLSDKPAEWGGRAFHPFELWGGQVKAGSARCRMPATDRRRLDPIIGRSQPVVRPPPHSAGRCVEFAGTSKSAALPKFASSPCGAARSSHDLTRHTRPTESGAPRRIRPAGKTLRSDPFSHRRGFESRRRTALTQRTIISDFCPSVHKRNAHVLNMKASADSESSWASKHWILAARRSRWAGDAGCDGRM